MKKTYELNVDLCVVGAGIAGICAAVSAGRLGQKVVLINDRPVPGGNASSEIGVKISGASQSGFGPSIYAKEGGLVEEIRQMILKYNEGNGYGNVQNGALIDAVLFDFIYNEENITLLLNTVVYDTTVEDDKITSVIATQLKSERKYIIKAPIFVDASGDGVVGYHAGASFLVGRESKEQWKETWAPEDGDSSTMGYTLYYETEDTGKKTTYKAPDFAYDITKMDFFKTFGAPGTFRGFSTGGKNWILEYGGHIDTIDDIEDINLELRKLIYGIWDYVKNSGKYDADNYILKRIYTVAGARESRRFAGLYTLTENDIEQKKKFNDAIASGGWPMDVHAPKGIYDTLPATHFIPVTGMYQIPFGCLCSKDIGNLMFCGRNISATHIALGSTRIMATCGAMGQACGTASYLCGKYGILPGDVREKYMDEMFKLLKKSDQTIVCTPDVFNSEDWRATATSKAEYENVGNDHTMNLKRTYALALSLETDMLDSVDIKIKNNSEKPTTLKYKLLLGTHGETYLPEKTVAEKEIVVTEHYDGYITVPVNQYAGEDGRVYIAFCPNKSIDLYCTETRMPGAVTFRLHTEDSHDGMDHDSCPLPEESGFIAIDHRKEEFNNIVFKNVYPYQDAYGAHNVLNPYSRPYKGANIYLAPAGSQTIYIVNDVCSNVSEIQLVFDSKLDSDLISEVPGNMIKKYKLTVFGDEEEKVFLEENNYKRICNHKVDMKNVSKITIELLENYGGDYMSIYSVKIF